MIAYCTHCGAALPTGSTQCIACGTAPAAALPPDNAATTLATWGLGPVALGVIALIPTALLVAALAAFIPLPVATVASAALLGCAQIFLAWLLVMRSWPPLLAPLGLKRPEVSVIRAALFTLAAIVCSLGFAQLYTMAVTALDWAILTPPELPADLLLPEMAAVFSIFALAIWTPVAEEIFFRGFVQRGLVNRWGPIPGLLVSAAVFATLHFSPAVLLPIFVTGLLLGGLYWRTGSLWPGIAVHAGQNFVAVLTILFEL